MPGGGRRALTLQNGLGNRELLGQALGARRVALGVTTQGATLLGPGLVRAAGDGAIILQEHPRLAPLAALLRRAGFSVETSPDPQALLWGKLVINAAINPLTALLGVPNGELLARPPAHALLQSAAGEAAAVAAALGMRLPYPDPTAAAENTARRTAANRSSMLQDVLTGRPHRDRRHLRRHRPRRRAGRRAHAGQPYAVAVGEGLEKRRRMMLVVESLSDLRTARAALPDPLGLVPTMGYLHEGHLSLVRAAKAECASTAVSIFVNPTQFGPQEDLSRYPRDLPRDLALLEKEGVDLVWTPAPETIYPAGYQTWVSVEALAQPLEGAMRPGHFRGVATVVAKLFNAVQPQKAYFGQKDAQQAAVIRRMAADLNFPLEVVVCPIHREADGLAMSSRNVYLSPDERRAAPALYRGLSAARQAFEQGERHADHLRQLVIDTVQAEPLASLQYVSCADPDTLQELHGPAPRLLISMAVFFGKTRLIDNIVIGDQ